MPYDHALRDRLADNYFMSNIILLNKPNVCRICHNILPLAATTYTHTPTGFTYTYDLCVSCRAAITVSKFASEPNETNPTPPT